MDLLVQTREILGKKIKSLRKQGFIPAELYGHGLENQHLSVSAKEFGKIFKQAGESTLIKLKVKDGKEFNVLIHDIVKNALTDEISNIDFYSVKMDEKIKARVPLEFIGESPAVKEKGGVLIKSMHEIEVESLPADLPHHLTVDVSHLTEIGSSLSVINLEAPAKVKILVNPKPLLPALLSPVKEKLAKKVRLALRKLKLKEKRKTGKQEKRISRTSRSKEIKSPQIKLMKPRVLIDIKGGKDFGPFRLDLGKI